MTTTPVRPGEALAAAGPGPAGPQPRIPLVRPGAARTAAAPEVRA
ncbi:MULTISPECIES: hypothetical protein [unclassified Streptomyces]|nr:MULTISPECIES: hypothetical protein [unclassified Streptomyces]